MPICPPDELVYAGTNLLTHPYRFAKTMPHNPHHYTLRHEWDRQTFHRTLAIMRQYGYIEHFQRKPYTMFNVNGHKYWTMGAPIAQTVVLNRKPLTDVPAPYDALAPAYDDAFADPASVAESREAVLGIVGDLTGKRVLDIGCGTGLLFDVATTAPAAYVGIDPSRAMLDRFAAKHPDRADQLIQAPLEEYVGDGFDLIISLFGSPAHIDPAHLGRIPGMLAPGGRYVLMYLADGYHPVAFARTGHEVAYRDGVTAPLPGLAAAWHNYLVLQGPGVGAAAEPGS